MKENVKTKPLEDRLPRETGWRNNKHEREAGGDCWRGKIYALYVYYLKKWLKVGEYCSQCSAVHIFKKFRDKEKLFFEKKPEGG